MKLRKYFWTATQKAAAFAKISKTETNPEGQEVSVWDSEKVAAVVDLGNPVVTPATYDEEGNILTEAVLSTKFEVDIVWVGEPDTDGMVWPTPCGHHSFGYALDQEYAVAYCEANPDALYCQPAELNSENV